MSQASSSADYDGGGQGGSFVVGEGCFIPMTGNTQDEVLESSRTDVGGQAAQVTVDRLIARVHAVESELECFHKEFDMQRQAVRAMQNDFRTFCKAEENAINLLHEQHVGSNASLGVHTLEKRPRLELESTLTDQIKRLSDFSMLEGTCLPAEPFRLFSGKELDMGSVQLEEPSSGSDPSPRTKSFSRAIDMLQDAVRHELAGLFGVVVSAIQTKALETVALLQSEGELRKNAVSELRDAFTEMLSTHQLEQASQKTAMDEVVARIRLYAEIYETCRKQCTDLNAQMHKIAIQLEATKIEHADRIEDLTSRIRRHDESLSEFSASFESRKVDNKQAEKIKDTLKESLTIIRDVILEEVPLRTKEDLKASLDTVGIKIHKTLNSVSDLGEPADSTDANLPSGAVAAIRHPQEVVASGSLTTAAPSEFEAAIDNFREARRSISPFTMNTAKQLVRGPSPRSGQVQPVFQSSPIMFTATVTGTNSPSVPRQYSPVGTPPTSNSPTVSRQVSIVSNRGRSPPKSVTTVTYPGKGDFMFSRQSASSPRLSPVVSMPASSIGASDARRCTSDIRPVSPKAQGAQTPGVSSPKHITEKGSDARWLSPEASGTRSPKIPQTVGKAIARVGSQPTQPKMRPSDSRFNHRASLPVMRSAFDATSEHRSLWLRQRS